MNILVIGSGGREHALVWKLRQSPGVKEIYCAPGNAGIAGLANCIPVKATDLRGLLKLTGEKQIDLTVVGPEQPLVMGIVDLFRNNGKVIFGPTEKAAQLEGSKAFAKDFMTRHNIPTAKYGIFSLQQRKEAEEFVRSAQAPLVVKADGLAAGKGVVMCDTKEVALLTLRQILEDKIFGQAGEKVVIEECLRGEEASIFALCDGTNIVTLAAAQDHKRILEGDLGKNTGGMGAYAPAPLMTSELRDRVVNEAIRPTLNGMQSEGTPYTGCLYVGLMVTERGPMVLEYNCRFGDPETQVVVPLIDGDFAELLFSASTGSLRPEQARQHPASAVCVVMASRGYPDDYETGKEIKGLDSVTADEGEVVFHAGTRNENGRTVTAGGRVLGVTAIGYGHDLAGTIHAAYRIVDRITFDGAYYRRDIGRKALMSA
ncbi:MAG TPA: phosphoribosylamine--glycine ligase [Bacteroidota bacterium]|nr:phosphoribosylamine--glycine ligase [Bacteroidota bacterium]